MNLDTIRLCFSLKCVEPMRSDLNFQNEKKKKKRNTYSSLNSRCGLFNVRSEDERKSRMFVCVCMWYRVYIYGKMGQLRYRMCKSVWVHARTTYNKHSFGVFMYSLLLYNDDTDTRASHIHAFDVYFWSKCALHASNPQNFIGNTFSVKLENGTSERDTHFTIACFVCVCVSLFAAFRIEWTNWT